MPYVSKEDRRWLDTGTVVSCRHFSAGQLNYLITRLCLQQSPTSYAEYNEIIGVLESVKLEFYRRAVAPYEDLKRSLNGDMYE